MMTLESLGRLVARKRGNRGIRATAKEIGIGPSTLSRVENGHLPDLENFRKICVWLGITPTSVVGQTDSGATNVVRAHFKKDGAIRQETASALAELILAAQRAIEMQETK